jgi:hypothetical protein
MELGGLYSTIADIQRNKFCFRPNHCLHASSEIRPCGRKNYIFEKTAACLLNYFTISRIFVANKIMHFFA